MALGHQELQDLAGAVVVRHDGTVAATEGIVPDESGRPATMLVADGEPELRHTEYDVEAAGAALRASGFPDVDDLIRESLVEPVDAASVARHFEGRTGT